MEIFSSEKMSGMVTEIVNTSVYRMIVQICTCTK